MSNGNKRNTVIVELSLAGQGSVSDLQRKGDAQLLEICRSSVSADRKLTFAQAGRALADFDALDYGDEYVSLEQGGNVHIAMGQHAAGTCDSTARGHVTARRGDM